MADCITSLMINVTYICTIKLCLNVTQTCKLPSILGLKWLLHVSRIDPMPTDMDLPSVLTVFAARRVNHSQSVSGRTNKTALEVKQQMSNVTKI